MKEIIADLTTLFEEAKQRSEFDFVLTLDYLERITVALKGCNISAEGHALRKK